MGEEELLPDFYSCTSALREHESTPPRYVPW